MPARFYACQIDVYPARFSFAHAFCTFWALLHVFSAQFWVKLNIKFGRHFWGPLERLQALQNIEGPGVGEWLWGVKYSKI